MHVIEPDQNPVVFTLTLTQFADGKCGISSKAENGNGMNLRDVRQLLQWGLNRVQDELLMAAVQNMMATQAAVVPILKNGK